MGSKKTLIVVLVVLGILGIIFICGALMAIFLSINPSKAIKEANTLSGNLDKDNINKCNPLSIKYESGSELVKDPEFTGNEVWKMQIWFVPNATTTDSNSYIPDGGYELKALGPTATSTRSGLVQEINSDVSNATSIILKASIKVDQASQNGSGSQGREAPIAIGMIYYDSNCLLHNTLGETPNDNNRMYWHGFNYNNGTGGYESQGFTLVNKGENYEFEADLSNLDISVIKSIGVEGSGWFQRIGRINSLSLIAN